jgi:hypothetical protein
MTFLLLLAFFAPPAPECTLVPGWTQRGEPRAHDKENLFEYMDGNAEGYIAYGFTEMRGVTCTKGDAILNIDLYEMADEESAYGIFMANRDTRSPQKRIGSAGQVLPRRATFVKGRLYAELFTEGETDNSAVLTEWATALEKKLTGSTQLPATLDWFPEGGSPRYVPMSVLGLRFLPRGYTADYADGRAFVVLGATPETAAKLKDRWKTNAAGCGTDEYLGSVCFFMKGKVLGGWVKAADEKTAAARAAALAARIP